MKLPLCPKCGGPKRLRAHETCARCRSHPKDACPRCGRPKGVERSMCIRCHALDNVALRVANANPPAHGHQRNICACGQVKMRYAKSCWECWNAILRARQPEMTYHHGGRAHVVVDGKRVRRARVVLEATIGRTLEPHEHVHHMNCDRSDDRPENLVPLTNREHALVHQALEREQRQAEGRMSKSERRAEASRRFHERKRAKAT